MRRFAEGRGSLSAWLLAVMAAGLAWSASTFAADIVEGPIIEPGAQPELVFDGAVTFLEGPARGPDGMIYVTDITVTAVSGMTAGVIWKNDPSTGKTDVFRSPSGMANGILFDSEGRLVAAEGADFGGQRITRTDMSTGIATIVAGTYNGKPFNSPNDVDIDSKGRIYFTDPRYLGHEPIWQPVSGVYRIDTDGKVTLLLADLFNPNGIAISPDEKTLYIADADFRVEEIALLAAGIPTKNGVHEIVAYDLDDGVPSNRRHFLSYGDGQDMADGLTTDADGNLYAAIRTKGKEGIHVYDSEANELAFVPTAGIPTNVMLTEIDGQIWMYFTEGANLHRIKTRVPPRSF